MVVGLAGRPAPPDDCVVGRADRSHRFGLVDSPTDCPQFRRVMDLDSKQNDDERFWARLITVQVVPCQCFWLLFVHRAIDGSSPQSDVRLSLAELREMVAPAMRINDALSRVHVRIAELKGLPRNRALLSLS